MAITPSTYYNFTRVRNESPEAQNWAAVDYNWELVSRILKSVEQHSHDGANIIKHPGYDYDNDDPANTSYQASTEVTLTEETDEGGVISPGSIIGVRLAYKDALGLETESSVEKQITLSAAASRPDTPDLSAVTEVTEPSEEEPGIPGGSYVYAITKKLDTGETALSDVVVVTVPYDGLYSVTLDIGDSIETYTDGTDAVCIYRSTGLNSTFQKVGTVTNTTETTFTDYNYIAPENQFVQPPTVSSFGASRAVKIDWSALTHPTEAKELLVYVTTEGGLWATEHLLATIDLTAETPDDYVFYLGSEAFNSGWPKDGTEIPYSAQKINLSTEATGGLALTATSDFNGHAVSNFKVAGSPTVTKANGMIWYDSNSLYARLNGSDVVVGTVTGTLDWANHPTEASGGHIADNISFAASSSTSVKDVLDTIVNSSTGARKQVHVVTAPSVGSETTRSSTSYGTLLTASGLTREFTDQWVEVFFSCDLKSPAATALVTQSTVSFQLAVGGTQQTNTQRSLTSNIADEATTFSCSWMIQLTSASATSIELQWKTDGQTWTAVSDRRQLYVKQVY